MIGAFWPDLAAIMLATAIVAAIADRRRMKRSDPDKVGFMPWTGILVMSLVVCIFATGIALKGL